MINARPTLRSNHSENERDGGCRKRTHELNEALREAILEPVLNILVSSGELDRMLDRLQKKEVDPYTLAEEVAKKHLTGCV